MRKRFTFTGKAFFLFTDIHSSAMAAITLIKGHGSENDFFIIDNLEQQFDDRSKSGLSKLLCNRKNILGGADGVLFMEKGRLAPHLMRIFNADGTEALMCGNGMRLAGRWSASQLDTTETTVENVTHLPYRIHLQDNFFKDVFGISILLPPAGLQQDFINNAPPVLQQDIITGFDEKNRYTAITMPNPHIVSFMDTIEDSKLHMIGKEANDNKLVFPQGVNVSWIRVQNDHTIFVSTYERGVGLTNACGTAMIASAVAGVLKGKLPRNETITVQNKGGFIQVTVHDDWSAHMTGNATFNAHYSIAVEGETIHILSHVGSNEQEKYDVLKTAAQS